MALQHQTDGSPSKSALGSMMKKPAAAKRLFSQHQPELMFYKSPGLSKTKGLIRKKDQLQPSHATYIEPLMKFFHDSIDFERVMEINKQELVLQDDFSVYAIFNILKGVDPNGANKEASLVLPQVDLQTQLSKLFNVKFSYKEIKLALMRQFSISSSQRVEQMRYQDFVDLMRPKNKEFQSYIDRKLKSYKDADKVISFSQKTECGLTFETHMKLGKFFEDLLQLENQLEMHRKYKLSQINIRDCFRVMDGNHRGFVTLEDYYNFFEDFYS